MPQGFAVVLLLVLLGLVVVSALAPHQVLGVAKDADRGTIRASFRELAMRYHPDKDNSPEAAEKFQQVYKAFKQMTGEEASDEDARWDGGGSSNQNGGFHFHWNAGGGAGGSSGNGFHFHFQSNDFSSLWADGGDTVPLSKVAAAVVLTLIMPLMLLCCSWIVCCSFVLRGLAGGSAETITQQQQRLLQQQQQHRQDHQQVLPMLQQQQQQQGEGVGSLRTGGAGGVREGMSLPPDPLLVSVAAEAAAVAAGGSRAQSYAESPLPQDRLRLPLLIKQRITAGLVDCALSVIAGSSLFYLTRGFNGEVSSPRPCMWLVWLAVETLYLVAHRGRTPGRTLAGIRVVIRTEDRSGSRPIPQHPLSPGVVLGRFVMKAIVTELVVRQADQIKLVATAGGNMELDMSMMVLTAMIVCAALWAWQQHFGMLPWDEFSSTIVITEHEPHSSQQPHQQQEQRHL